MFPDDRFWNLGYPTGSSELAVNWSHGKNWKALVFKELNFLFEAFLGKLKIMKKSLANKGQRCRNEPCGYRSGGAVPNPRQAGQRCVCPMAGAGCVPPAGPGTRGARPTPRRRPSPTLSVVFNYVFWVCGLFVRRHCSQVKDLKRWTCPRVLFFFCRSLTLSGFSLQTNSHITQKAEHLQNQCILSHLWKPRWGCSILR